MSNEVTTEGGPRFVELAPRKTTTSDEPTAFRAAVEYDSDGWSFAYFVEDREGTVIVTEVRIFPSDRRTPTAKPTDDRRERRIGEWSPEYARVPPRGLPSRLRSKLTPGRAASDALGHAKRADREDDLRPVPSRTAARALRTPKDAYELRLPIIAVHYERAKARGSRTPALDVWRELRDDYGLHYARTTVRDLIRRTRVKGLLHGDTASMDAWVMFGVVEPPES